MIVQEKVERKGKEAKNYNEFNFRGVYGTLIEFTATNM